jgi:hypothetical protein
VLVLCSPFSGEMGLVLFTVYSKAYIVLYMFYLGVNRLQIYIRKGKFNDGLFFFPLISVLVCYFHSTIVYAIYRNINKNFYTYVSMNNGKVVCLDNDKCHIEYDAEGKNEKGISYATIVIRDFIEKRYRIETSSRNGCTIITTSNYALVKFGLTDCPGQPVQLYPRELELIPK